MDPNELLQKFKSREFNPCFGYDPNTILDYDNPERIIDLFKSQKPMNGYQFVSRVLRLCGVGKKTAWFAEMALIGFARGTGIPDLSSMNNLSFGLLTLTCGQHRDYHKVFSPIPMISLDKGKTWLGFDAGKIAIYSSDTWLSRSVYRIFSLAPLRVSENLFHHDFRKMSIFIPSQAGFKPFRNSNIDNQYSRFDMYERIINISISINDNNYVPPPFNPQQHEIIDMLIDDANISPQPQDAETNISPHARDDDETGEPAAKKARHN